MRLPVYDFFVNWLYMVMFSLAWNLKAWFAMMMQQKSNRDGYLRMAF